MAKTIQIRNVPEDVHRSLKVRAAQEGMSLSELLLKEVTALARRPTLKELVERVRQRESVHVSVDSPSAVRHERGARR